jgi:hypothetical protein
LGYFVDLKMPPRRELTREEKNEKNRKAREKRSLEDPEEKKCDWPLRGKGPSSFVKRSVGGSIPKKIRLPRI